MKHDGYRILVIRENDRVRLLSRKGSDWTKRYPWIAEAALKNRQKHFVIDGEAVVLGVDGISDFNALHSRKHDHEVQLYAFDILAMGGDDLRELPLHLRKPNLERLLAPGRTASPWRPLSAARSGPTSFGLPAVWDLRDWSPSIAIALPRRPAEVLGQDQEPQSPCDGARAVIGLVVTAIRVSIAIASQSGFPKSP